MAPVTLLALIQKLAFYPLSSSRIVRPSSLASSGVRASYWRQASLFPHDLETARCTKLLSGDCPSNVVGDLDHWLVILEPPEPPSLSRYEITVSYIKTLAELLGSEEEAKKSIYSVYRLAFGCTVSEELSYKIKTLPKVRWVICDPFFDLPPPMFDLDEWSSYNKRRTGKTEVRDNPRDRYVQRQSENMQKYDDGLIRDINKRMWEFTVNPPKRYFPPTYQLVDHGYGYPRPVNVDYRGGNQGYHGGGQGYQARNLGGSMSGGSGYQANNSYQGHGPGYQGGAPAYGDNNFRWGDDSGYQGDGAGPVHGQTGGSSSYQGVDGPNFQTAGPGYQGIRNYHADGAYYQARDFLKEVMAVTLKQVGHLTASWARLPRKPRLSG